MKPAPFDWHAPDSVEAALALQAAHGDDARFLAGGQSLVPAMNFRVAQPAVLVDLNRVPWLGAIEVAADGSLASRPPPRLRARGIAPGRAPSGQPVGAVSIRCAAGGTKASV